MRSAEVMRREMNAIRVRLQRDETGERWQKLSAWYRSVLVSACGMRADVADMDWGSISGIKQRQLKGMARRLAQQGQLWGVVHG